MLYEACSFACCSFSGRYIYKFGGFGENNTILHNIVYKITNLGTIWLKDKSMGRGKSNIIDF